MTVSDVQRVHRNIAAEISFPTLAAKEYVTYLEMRRADLEVGTARANFFPVGGKSDPRWLAYLKSGTPVHIAWKVDGSGGNFYGYANDISWSNQGSMIQVRCSGVGYPLLFRTGRASVQGTMQHALSLVASNHRLRYAVDRIAPRVSNLVQGGKTDWDWLVDMAEAEGRSLHTRGSTIVAHRLDHMLSTSVSSFIDVDIADETSTPALNVPQTGVSSFRVYQSDLGAHGMLSTRTKNRTMAAGGVTEVLSDGDPSLPAQVDIEDSGSPQTLSLRNHDREDRWTTRATLVMDGIPVLQPLDVVRTTVLRTGVRSLWSVLSVEQRVGNGEDTMTVEMGKEEGPMVDNLLDRPSRSTEIAMWNATDDMGSQRWTSIPLLRYRTAPKPGRGRVDEARNRRWTAEVSQR